VLLVGGLAALLLGFLRLAGRPLPDLPFLPSAGLLLGAGFSLVLWNLGRTLWAARPLPLPARFVATGLVCLAATVAFGIIFTLALGAVVSSPIVFDLTARGLPIHIIAGLGGWLTFCAMGVSYRLLSMFMLAPDADGPTTRAGLHAGTGALALAIIGGTIAIWLNASTDVVLAAAGALGLVALALYGRDIIHLYRARKRRKIELNSRMAAFALASLAIAVALTIVFGALGELQVRAPVIIFLVAFGWLTGLGLGKLYKIVAFLTWLECYGPVLGKQPTPRVQDLVVESRAYKWFLLYFAAVWGGAVALGFDSVPFFRGAAAAMLLATAGIILQLVRARRLADVNAATRLPEGSRRPRLLLALTPNA
jgi:hypothetical protein